MKRHAVAVWSYNSKVPALVDFGVASNRGWIGRLVALYFMKSAVTK